VTSKIIFALRPRPTVLVLVRLTNGGTCTPKPTLTQGKIERWHQTLKKRILLENYYLPGDLEAQIDAFVGHYNHNARFRVDTVAKLILTG